jgi:hypothetical protein
MYKESEIKIKEIFIESEDTEPTSIYIIPSGFKDMYNIVEEDPIFGPYFSHKNQTELDEFLKELKKHYGK